MANNLNSTKTDLQGKTGQVDDETKHLAIVVGLGSIASIVHWAFVQGELSLTAEIIVTALILAGWVNGSSYAVTSLFKPTLDSRTITQQLMSRACKPVNWFISIVLAAVIS